MADDRDTFHDAFGAGRSDDADRWPANESGPAGDVAAPKTGKSGVVKVLLILLAVGVVAGVLCCGGVIWWFSQNVKVVTTPAEVTAMTDEIMTIDVPDAFTPQMGMKMNVIVANIDMVMYQTPGDGMLQLMRATGEGMNDPQAQRQFDAQMRQQGGGAPRTITVKNTETKTVSIDGKDVEFTIGTGPESQSGAEWKEVNGSIPQNGGVVSIKLQQSSETFDEEQVTKMLESIKPK